MTASSEWPPLSPRQRVTWLVHLSKALLYQHHKEMLPVFRPYLPPDGTAIDVGAHAGQFTKLFSKMAPRGHVHSFEPGGYALSLLRKAAARRPNVTIHPYGLGEANENLTLNVPLKKSGSVGYGSGFVGDGRKSSQPTVSETVKICRLDDVVEAWKMPRVDFVKIDIEGSELRMLKGAQATLLRFSPALFVEITDQTLARGGSVEMLVAHLRGIGYAPVGGWPTPIPNGDYLLLREPAR